MSHLPSVADGVFVSSSFARFDELKRKYRPRRVSALALAWLFVIAGAVGLLHNAHPLLILAMIFGAVLSLVAAAYFQSEIDRAQKHHLENHAAFERTRSS